MARDDGLGNDRSPLGTVLGVFLCILGFGSAILWHATGGVFTSPMGWLMGDVTHTTLEVGTVIVLLLGLAFAAFVAYANRVESDRLAVIEDYSADELAATAVLPTVGQFAPPSVPRPDRRGDRGPVQ